MSTSMSFNPQETDNKWKPDERSSLGLGVREIMENRYKGFPEEKFDRQWCRVWKCCEIEQGASEEILGVAQIGKTEETVWQP